MASTSDELERILAAGMWRELDAYLAAPEDSETGRELRKWYDKRRAHWTRTYDWSWDADGDRDPAACLRILAVGLSSPDDAAKRIAKTAFAVAGAGSDDGIATAMSRRGLDWTRETIELLSNLRLHPIAEQRNGWLASLTLAVIARGEYVHLPSGELFGRSWATFYSWRGVSKWSHSEGDEPPPAPGSRLLSLLRTSPMLAESLSQVIATPSAVGILENGSSPGGELAPAVAQLIADSVLDRQRVLEDVLAALTRQDTPATQKGLAKLLGALELSPADAAPRMPLLLGLLATSRGPVTAVLLPPMLGAASGQEVVDLAGTIFARTERAQRVTLLAALTTPDAVERWGADAVAASLGVATEAADAPTAKKAAAALARLGRGAVSPVEMPLAAWAPPPSWPEPCRATAIAPDAAAMSAALSRLHVGRSPADPAMFWDALVRWAFRDVREAREWAAHYTGWDSKDTDHLEWAAYSALHAATKPYTLDRYRELRDATASARTGVRTSSGPSYVDGGGSLARHLGEVLAAETSLRLGSSPFLVSTPSTDDGTLHFDDFIGRLRDLSPGTVGTFDFLVALLRLERVDPARAGELDAVQVRLWTPDSESRFRLRRAPVADAASIARGWILGGGRPELPVHYRGTEVTVAPVTLPLDLSLFHGFPIALLTGYAGPSDGIVHDWNVDVEREFGVIPGWTDHVAASLQGSFDQAGRLAPPWLPMMAASPEPGLAIQRAVAETLGHEDTDHRLAASESALTMMGRGRWDSDAYTFTCLQLLGEGRLRLARLGHSWEQVILGGGIQPLWPTVVAVLDAAAGLDRVPNGLADLLAVIRRHIGAVPQPELPASVRRLAASKGSSKARLEAASLVEAVEGRAA